ncbi:MAG: ecdysteroid 22-kinase family protein [Dehalococcoidia bacterium]|nr:ecdysteroid 22-kinase family protein [Dehalococcoidia bacterium]
MTTTTATTPPMSRIPSRLTDLTPEWFTGALRNCGALGDACSVAAIEVKQLGEGEGFLGELGRVHLTYVDGAGPASVIAKFPSPIPENRALGMTFGSYEKEILAYRELGPHFTVKVPQCFFGEFETRKRAETVVQRVLAFLPDAVTIRLLNSLMSQAGKSERRFGLLLEDLGAARVGDQVKGCTPAEAELALRTLARLHAAFWESPLLDRTWLLPADDAVAVQHAIYRRAWPVFEQRFHDALTPEMRAISAWNDVHGPDLIHRVSRSPRTLLHGDFRADNIMFHDDGPEPMTIIDWQGVMTGNPMIDVAYFLRPNMATEDAEAHEAGLVDAYHEALVEAGVRGYSLQDCRRDYVLGQLWVMHRGVLLIGTLDLSHERGAQIVDNAVSRSMRAAPNIDLTSISL